MAENFEDVVKKLGSTVKKSTVAKAPAVLAVQIVDSKGKIIGGEGRASRKKGASGAEEKRESIKREQKTNTLLSSILKALGGEKIGAAEAEKERKKKGGLIPTLAKFALGHFILKRLLPAGALAALGGTAVKALALGKLGIGGVVLAGVLASISAVSDGIKGIDWARKMKLEDETGFIAKFLGGNEEGGIWNAAAQAITGVGIGATVGLKMGGPVGMVIGAILGGAIFGLAGFFGAGAIAEWINPLVQRFKTMFGMETVVSEKMIEKARQEVQEAAAIRDAAIATNNEIERQLSELRLTERNLRTAEQINEIAILAKRSEKTKKAIEEADRNFKAAAKASLLLERAEVKNEEIGAARAIKENKFAEREIKEEIRLATTRKRRAEGWFGFLRDENAYDIAVAELQEFEIQRNKIISDRKILIAAHEKAKAAVAARDLEIVNKAIKLGGFSLAPGPSIAEYGRSAYAAITNDVEKLTREMFGQMYGDATYGDTYIPKSLSISPPNFMKRTIEYQKSLSEFMISYKLRDRTKEGFDKDIKTEEGRQQLLSAFFNYLSQFGVGQNFKTALAKSAGFDEFTKEQLTLDLIHSLAADLARIGPDDWAWLLPPGPGMPSGPQPRVKPTPPVRPLPLGISLDIKELDKRFPRVFMGGEAAAMVQAGIQRAMGGGTYGGGITSINTGGNVVSSPTTNYVNNGIAARRPILLTASMGML